MIAGLGCAGACAALEARAAGADVLVLERAALGGGTSALSGGLIYLGGGTPVQKQTGFEDSPEQMFAYLMAACGPGADEAKIRLFCERSVEHFHWLVAQGVPFKASFHPESGTEPPTDDGLIFSGSEAAHPFAALARPAPRGHHPQKEGAAGGFLMQKLLAAVAASGARQLTGARCVSLVLGGERPRGGSRGAHARGRARGARAARRRARDRRLHPGRRDARAPRALAAALQGADRLRGRRRLRDPARTRGWSRGDPARRRLDLAALLPAAGSSSRACS